MGVALLAVAGCTIPQPTPPDTDQKSTITTAASSAARPTPLGPTRVDALEVANPAPAIPAQRAQIIGGTGALIGTASRLGAGATATAGDITLNFVNTDVREVLPRVLGDILHLTTRLIPRSRRASMSRRCELLVLLSPKIVHNAADARAATDELRSRLHSLQSSDMRLP